MGIGGILKAAQKHHASDIHLAVGYPVTFRIDGVLKTAGKPLTQAAALALMKETLSVSDWKAFLAAEEWDYAYAAPYGRFRMNLHIAGGNPALAARVIRTDIPTFDEIGLPDVCEDFTHAQHGLVLVTGAAGSGKSTTLAAMLGRVFEDRPAHVLTFEDPIEYVFTPKQGMVKQREIGVDTHSFSDALKHALRQNPDVIMVGEMRDLETMAATITLAETGHLVFSTLHTRTAASTVSRIIDSFPAEQQAQVRTQLALSLRAVISQTLLPRKGGGLVAAREIMVNTPAIASLIRQNKIEQVQNVIQTSRREGMISMSQALTELERNGDITAKERTRFLATL